MGDLTRAHALLQVPFSAAMLCGRGRDRGRIGGCSHNNNQGFWLRRWLSLTVIDHRYTCDLPWASCNRNTRLCTQGGLGSCAFIAITRHIQVPTGQLAVCEFGMNVLVLVCVYDLYLLPLQLNVIQYNNWHWHFKKKNATKTSTRRLSLQPRHRRIKH